MSTRGVFDPGTGSVDAGVKDAHTQPVAGYEHIASDTAVGKRSASANGSRQTGTVVGLIMIGSQSLV
jgi:hypothetical protein